MKLNIIEDLDQNNLILEGTRYDKQASKILSDSGLFDPETADAIIDGLFKNDIHAFVHSPNWLEKYLKGIARMCVEESKGDKNKAIKFLNDSPQVFDKYLTWVKENREEYGTKLDDEFINKLSYKDVVDFLEKIQAELDKKSEEELANMDFSSSNYELVPIDSFEQFNSLFGGKATGDGSSDKYAGGGGTAWCHANSESTYNSSTWAGNPYHKFYVLANKDWKKIKFDPKSNSSNPKDDYGNSLIALLVDTRTGRLLNATLRCNHVGVSSNADNQYKTYSELSKIAGFNVRDAINSDLDISIDVIDSSMSVKDVWYKYFDGTAESVDKICEILDTSREDITEAYISDSITEISYQAFINCKSLTSITIPNSVTSIGVAAFEGCSSLTSVTIPNSVTSIGYRAFFRCKSLTSITIPNGVTTIDSYTFYECTSLTSITIPDSVTSIGIFAFDSCTSLTNITIPNSVTKIGSYVFHNCTSFTNITIPDSVTVIDIGAFNDCTSLTNITIPNNVTRIGAGTFAGCKSLTSVKIPDSVTEIGSNAFYSCTSLTSIIIPDSVTNISNSTFRDCTSLTVTTNNSYVIKYCEDNNIPVKNLKESLFNSKNKNENFRGGKMSKYLEVLCESVMTPTPTPYVPDSDVSTHPTYILVVFNKDKESLLSPRGSIVTTFASQGDLDNYANNLYDLIRDAFEVYSIIPELYSQAITKFKSNKDFYDYIHDNGILHKRVEDMSNEEAIYSDIIDADTDFNI